MPLLGHSGHFDIFKQEPGYGWVFIIGMLWLSAICLISSATKRCPFATTIGIESFFRDRI